MRDRYGHESIIHMSPGEWRALDAAEFARATLAQCTEHPGVFERVYAIAYPELLRRHLAHLDLVGEDRAKVLFTTLRNCCNRVVPGVLTEEIRHAH